MNETLVTMIGNVASAVSYGQTAAGVPTANFRLAATERRYDRARSEWVDGDTNWVTVTVWRGLATNVVSSLGKGDPVLVCGRLRIREWEEEGRRRNAVEIDARSVGHDLGRGTSAFRWAVRGRSEVVPAQPVGGTAGEAVPEWITAAIREYRATQAERAERAAQGARSGEADGAGGDANAGVGVGVAVSAEPCANGRAVAGELAVVAGSTESSGAREVRGADGEEGEEGEEGASGSPAGRAARASRATQGAASSRPPRAGRGAGRAPEGQGRRLGSEGGVVAV
ncbi:single-stranded DNA-binding protein [Kitasatospora sp. NBC_01287]|uniref:single-stranded DNA-binding protein n=1 Tax=Kitasatospora sp. NBC_01287 TaxID=2903573 RepID=UPI00224CC28F|nr:single-stranded DNA-binding protein [Kitasatospora sp. NBC_01287]MCX4746356.1 single-stranded DNA-binding protein [Kitasatospora sp. NBC_01287]